MPSLINSVINFAAKLPVFIAVIAATTVATIANVKCAVVIIAVTVVSGWYS